MPTDLERFSLIHKAAGLPKGDPTRRKILAKLAAEKHDPRLEKRISKSVGWDSSQPGEYIIYLVKPDEEGGVADGDYTLVDRDDLQKADKQKEKMVRVYDYQDRKSLVSLAVVQRAMQNKHRLRLAALDDTWMRQEHQRRKEKAAEALKHLEKAQRILSDLTGPWRRHSRSLDQLIKTLQ